MGEEVHATGDTVPGVERRGAVGRGNGIEFSVAVVIAAERGKLVAEVPRQVAERLGAGAGDVLCWTGFEDGTVEAWSVRKSPYASLDDASEGGQP